MKLKKRCEEIENENTSYHDKLSNAQSEINTLKVKKSSEDRKIQKALNLYYDYERQKIGLDTKSLILENSQRETEQERREYEKRKNDFEGKLDEIKKWYNVLLKFILIVFVPVVLASILTNVGKTKAIIDFLYYVFVWPMLQSKSLIPMLAEKFSMEQYMAFFLLASVYGLYCCGWLALFSISYIKIRAKIRLTSMELNYKSLNDTYFLPVIFFAEFVVVVYVGIFSFMPINSFFLYLIVVIITYFIYQAYIRGKLKIPSWKFK